MTLVHAPPAAEARLFELSAHRPAVALCAQDAHGTPPYEAPFAAMSMVIPGSALPEDADQAAAFVLGALTSGQSHCAFDALGDTAGFALEGSAPDRTLKQGDRVRVVLPPTGAAQARVIVTGAGHLENETEVVAERPGPLRIEVQLLAPGCAFGDEWRPWIIPSPLLVAPRG
jgi:hypothetical protein